MKKEKDRIVHVKSYLDEHQKQKYLSITLGPFTLVLEEKPYWINKCGHLVRLIMNMSNSSQCFVSETHAGAGEQRSQV